MADSFFPDKFDTVATPPGLNLTTAKYVMRATVFNPISNADEPLPEHVWQLVLGSGPLARAITRSTLSDASGVCGLTPPATLPPGNYSFVLLPEPKDVRAAYIQNREAWIDLDANQKVTVPLLPGARDWAKPAPTSNVIERRKLLRIPAWSTLRKAKLGGFLKSPTGTSVFSSEGFIPNAELTGFGTPGAPWEIPLDFRWVKARVQFFFFDWPQNNAQILPPGLVVEAVREEKNSFGAVLRTRLGAGTPISANDGTFYMLLEGEKAAWSTCHIRFTAPKDSFVDLRSKTTPSPDLRLDNKGPVPINADDRNLLPPNWHSLGMRANFTTALNGAKAPKDKTWDNLRSDIANDAGGDEPTLIFHLDDVVICDRNGISFDIKKGVKRPTLFDHFLTIINPDPDAPYQTLLDPLDRVIPAEVAFNIAGKPKALELSTRLIHFEGRFCDLRDDRIPVADANKQRKCIGARAAKEKQHPSLALKKPLPTKDLLGFLDVREIEMHLIEVPGVADPDSGIGQLQHVLLYSSVEIEVDDDFPSADLAKLPNLERDTRRNLAIAGERWSPGHPGTKELRGKRYALVPQDAGKRNNRITRFRTFFAESTRNPKLKISLQKDDGKARASSGPAFVIAGQSKITYFDTTVDSDTKGTFGSLGDNIGDGSSRPFHTLTHEFGHALGLMDEYVERVQPAVAIDPSLKIDSHPFMPSFDQVDEGFSDYRPYYTDLPSVMVFNSVPRLRHFWHHCKNVNDQFSSTLKDLPYVLVHETFDKTGLTYRDPPEGKSPFHSKFEDVEIPGGHGRCALFPLGEDEGTVGKMFRTLFADNILSPGQRMQALLIVRSRLRFVFDAAMTPPERLKVMQTDFQEKMFDADYRPKIRFVLQGAGPFPRIAVLFHPLYAVGEKQLSKKEIFESADLIFDIAKAARPPRTNPFLGDLRKGSKGSRLSVMASDFRFELALRAILGIPTALPAGKGPDLGVIRSTDIQPLATLVEGQLGEAPGSRTIAIYP